jgi:hypothetical protein
MSFLLLLYRLAKRQSRAIFRRSRCTARFAFVSITATFGLLRV